MLFSGADAAGQSNAIFSALASYAITIIDVEQVVIHKRLLLTILIELDSAHHRAIEREMEEVARQLELDFAMEISAVTTISPHDREGVHVVVLGNPLTADALAHVAHSIARCGGNIERIHRTVSYPITAFEITASITSQSFNEMKRSLSEISRQTSIDLSIEPATVRRNSKRLVMLDVDSTFIQQEVIDLLAAKAGNADAVAQITQRAMNGEIDFQQSLRQRVSLLKGLPVTVLDQVRSEITLTPGAKTLVRTLHSLGHKVGVVSGGFLEIIAPIADQLQLDFVLANSLDQLDGVLSGTVREPIVDRAAKAQALRAFAAQEKIDLSQTVAVGDGANDIDMLEIAGMGIAFNAKPILRESADASITNPYLDSVLYLLGITREMVERATRS